MTGGSPLLRIASMHKFIVLALLMGTLGVASPAAAQKDKDNEPTSALYFVVVKEDTGKPVRNAAVIMHPVNTNGKQARGGLELKTDPEGKANFDGIPYGKLRVQVLAHGYQTYGEDFDIEKDKTEITIKLKRPQGQFSVYDDHPTMPAKPEPPKQDASSADSKKPN